MAILNLNGANEFNEKVLSADRPVLVDFWAPWCGPCKMLAPELEKVAQEYEGKAIVAKVNVDDNQQLASTYGVMGIPTMVIFKGGREVGRMVGFRPQKDIGTAIDAAL